MFVAVAVARSFVWFALERWEGWFLTYAPVVDGCALFLKWFQFQFCSWLPANN